MKYSVIIPIYNAQNTLDRCLGSLLPQLNENVEVLLINDGSKDNSADICKKYVEKSPQFKYFEQENSGVSAARNKGIENAKGEYILFIDSDDYVLENTFELLENETKEEKYDSICFSWICFSEKKEKKIEQKSFISHKKSDIYSKISKMICCKDINAPFAKLYKREIINNYAIRFPDACSIAEDRAFNIAYALHINSLKVTNKHFYCYYVGTDNAKSLSRTVRTDEDLEYNFKMAKEVIDFALSNCNLEKKYVKKICDAENFGIYGEVYSNAKRRKLRGASKKEIVLGIKNDCKKINENKPSFSKTIYCCVIAVPVKIKLYFLIYLVAMKLVRETNA